THKSCGTLPWLVSFSACRPCRIAFVMLDQRARILLKTLVERYIAEGEPVGSRALSKYSGLDLSPATVRNVMADLEEMGFISSPHTSAGRVPTPRGYRLFVDTLLTIKPIDRIERDQLEDHLLLDHPQRTINAASQLLSEPTHFAGIGVAPLRPRLPAHRIPGAVRKARAAHHRHARRRRAEPDSADREELLAQRIDHSGQLPQPELRGVDLRRDPPAPARGTDAVARGHDR